MKNIISVCIAILAVMLISCSAFAHQQTSLTIRPNLIPIGTNFNGADLTITGKVPEGTSAVIRLLGEPRDEFFKQKGKALGVLWMNLKTVELKQVPDVFLMGTDSETNVNWEHSDLGFLSIKGDTEESIFDEFIKLMERDDFYNVQKGTVAYEQPVDGMKPFSATLKIPSAMHKGVYEVEVIAIKDGKVIEKASEELHTKLTGLPAMLSAFAFDHSLMYGIAAVIIAILAGLIMSMIFKERGGAH